VTRSDRIHLKQPIFRLRTLNCRNLTHFSSNPSWALRLRIKEWSSRLVNLFYCQRRLLRRNKCYVRFRLLSSTQCFRAIVRRTKVNCKRMPPKLLFFKCQNVIFLSTGKTSNRPARWLKIHLQTKMRQYEVPSVKLAINYILSTKRFINIITLLNNYSRYVHNPWT
jgi:hypothetical protein